MKRHRIAPLSKIGTVTALVFVVLSPLETDAQSRMPPISADAMTEAQKKAVEEFRAQRGVDLSPPFFALLRSPELMVRSAHLGEYLRHKSVLPDRLSEFVILITARRWSQQYEWSVHQPIALKAGLGLQIVTAVAQGRRPGGMTEHEGALRDFCNELNANQSVSDARYGRMAKAFGEQGVIDTIGIVGYYTMVAMVLNTARVPPNPQGPTMPPLR